MQLYLAAVMPGSFTDCTVLTVSNDSQCEEGVLSELAAVSGVPAIPMLALQQQKHLLLEYMFFLSQCSGAISEISHAGSLATCAHVTELTDRPAAGVKP